MLLAFVPILLLCLPSTSASYGSACSAMADGRKRHGACLALGECTSGGGLVGTPSPLTIDCDEGLECCTKDRCEVVLDRDQTHEYCPGAPEFIRYSVADGACKYARPDTCAGWSADSHDRDRDPDFDRRGDGDGEHYHDSRSPHGHGHGGGGGHGHGNARAASNFVRTGWKYAPGQDLGCHKVDDKKTRDMCEGMPRHWVKWVPDLNKGKGGCFIVDDGGDCGDSRRRVHGFYYALT